MPRNPSKVGFENSGWRRMVFGQVQGAFIPETHVLCGWDKLLDELHLTEEAAWLAVEANDKLGAKLRLFARRVHRVRYVPEDVLALLDLSSESGDGTLSLLHLRKGDAG